MTANTNNIKSSTLISYQKALEIINSVADKHTNNKKEKIKLLDAINRFQADPILAPINVPSFDNSAMDGFAIKSEVVNKAIKQKGSIKLKVTGSIQAGDQAEIDINIDELAWEIMTGAPVPIGFDAVIQIENVVISSDEDCKYITISENVKKDRNIRKLGTDYKLNQSVTEKHTIIQAQHIMALATVGIKDIEVIPQIKVAILSTGNELAKKSSNSLNSGKIFNSNQPYLKSISKNLNCDPVFVGRCKDNIEDFNKLIDEALSENSKLIFSTGAVSMGKYDFIPQALINRGAKIHFHKAKIRPGKPILFAELDDGTIYFGLPGNPIAAAAGMRFFVSPFIRTLLGLPEDKPTKARLLNDINKNLGFRTFAKAHAKINELGQVCVDMLLDQGSYQSRSFAQSNCWIILPENKSFIKTGELIDIAPMVPNKMIF
jgi:molybdopterin molybdotransferase